MALRLIKPSDRFFVAGAHGMAGSAIVRALKRSGYGDPVNQGALLTPRRQELDLLDDEAVSRWMTPKARCSCTSCGCGIEANRSRPAEFLLENSNRNPGDRSRLRAGARRLLFLESSCIYPKFAEQPIREESLLTGVEPPTPGTPSPRLQESNSAKRCASSTASMRSA